MSSDNPKPESTGLEAALPALLMLGSIVLLLILLLGSSDSEGGEADGGVSAITTATPTVVVLEQSSTPRPASNTPTPIVLPGSTSAPALEGSSTATEAAPTETSSPTSELEEATPTTTSLPEEPTTESTTHEGHESTGADEESAEGDAANGETLFNTFQPLASFSCSNCHLVNSEAMLIGPGLLNVSQHAADHETGLSVVEYLHQSIVDPNAYVVEGYTANLMPQTYAQVFTEQEISDIIAYLLTLEG